MGLFPDSLHYFEHAIKLCEDSTYLINYVKSLLKLQEINKSIEVLSKVCNIDPLNSDAHFMLANAFYESKDYHKAVEYFRHAIELTNNSALIFNNLALSLQKINKIDESMITFDQALLLEPNTSEFYYNKAFLCEENYFFLDAIDLYKKSIEINPNAIDSFINLGIIFLKQREYKQALFFFQKVLDIDAKNIKSNINIGYTYLELREHINAIKYFKNAFEIDPNYPLLFGVYLHTKMLLCDWHSFSSDLEHVYNSINNRQVISTPFPILSLTDSSELQLKTSNYFVDHCSFNKLHFPEFIKNSHSHSKIKIGYYSSDFNNHPVAYLTTWIFESHNRNLFEIYGFSYGEIVDVPIQKRIFESFDFVYDVKDSSDFDIFKLSTSLSIDIAIDLSGYTQKGRPSIFNKFRCAPIQISFLGYIGTTGSPNIDYLISDTNCIFNEDLPFFTENIIRLPVSFQFNDPSRLRPVFKNSKSNLGIPEDSFVFCCFNDTYKILPDIFTAWMDILKAVEDSVLWLIVDSDIARNNLTTVAKSNNISVNRLIFSPRVPYSDYLSRFAIADLFLDTYPYSSGTTATDALWMNLPLVTIQGNSFVSRMASSQLRLIGLNKLIAKDINEYKKIAINLANDRVNLQEVINCLTHYNSEIFQSNSKIYLSSLELAYSKVYDIYKTNTPLPKIIDI
jgi:predicted O-linked N-acetylglucosamine transferase (SPINDLY family)